MLATILFALLGCAKSTPPRAATPVAASTAMTVPATGPATMLDETTVPGAANTPAGAQPQLAADPARLADDLVADEQALHDPSAPEEALALAARRQQAAYRAIGRHPEWDAITRPRIPPPMLEFTSTGRGLADTGR
jgi:hypothetical protein